MNKVEPPKDEVRERIILVLGNALYAGKSLEQISKITKKQLAPFEAAADQILTLIKLQQEALLNRVEKEVIGEDEKFNDKDWLIGKTATLSDVQRMNYGRNYLKAKQRETVNKLRLEL